MQNVQSVEINYQKQEKKKTACIEKDGQKQRKHEREGRKHEIFAEREKQEKERFRGRNMKG